jgi:hypothetical protein
MCIFNQMEDGRLFCMSCAASARPGSLQIHGHLPGQKCAAPCECSADYDREALRARITGMREHWAKEGTDYIFDDSGNLVWLRRTADVTADA